MRLFPRENYLKKIRGFYHDDGMIKAIAGIRRCGKSCLMQCIAEELRAEGGFSIFITGSNSYLLSGELATKLTGRYIEFEMQTLDFGENRPFEQIRDNYPKYLLTRSDPIQQRDGIIHANIPEFMQEGRTF